MAHEHLLKAHIYLHTASGDTPILEYRRLRSHILKLVTSRRFQKWCSSGVVSAFLLCKTIDFTGFFRTFRDTAVADKQNSGHFSFHPLFFSTSITGIFFCVEYRFPPYLRMNSTASSAFPAKLRMASGGDY